MFPNGVDLTRAFSHPSSHDAHLIYSRLHRMRWPRWNPPFIARQHLVPVGRKRAAIHRSIVEVEIIDS
jgi:hypothetical protein